MQFVLHVWISCCSHDPVDPIIDKCLLWFLLTSAGVEPIDKDCWRGLTQTSQAKAFLWLEISLHGLRAKGLE